MSKIIKLAFIITGLFAGILFNKGIDLVMIVVKDVCYQAFLVLKHKNLFTSEELSEYNGEARPELYLAFMGAIYDVGKGYKHYGKGSSYHYFAGKDGTRAFVTGDFNDSSEKKDHILDLSCDELLGLVKWKKTIKEKYKLAGYLMGRYYDRYAAETPYHMRCLDRIGRCLLEREAAKAESRKLPSCNVAWSPEEGTRVWCTKSSGGVTRNWTGVPREYYTPGSEKPRCVCVKDTSDPPSGMFKEYANCASTSTSCNIE